jgi:GNAT superfamily N-acetyltransferase
MMLGSQQTKLVQHVGELGEAAVVMRRSWAENTDQPLLYESEFLESFLKYPGRLSSIAPAIYTEEKLAAFVCGSCRTATIQGDRLNLLLMSFFTVAPEFKGQGFGKRIWTECVQMARAAGYDGVLHYCVVGNRSNEVTQAAIRSAGFDPVHVFTVSYLMRFLAQSKTTSKFEGMPADPQRLVDLSNALTDAVSMARVLTLEEAQWDLSRRTNPVSVQGPSSAVQPGLVSGYTMEIDDHKGTRCTMLDNALWNHLSSEDQTALLQQFMTNCAGSQVLVVPVLNYASSAPFEKLRFRRSTRVLNAYLTPFSKQAIPQLSSMFIDVL